MVAMKLYEATKCKPSNHLITLYMADSIEATPTNVRFQIHLELGENVFRNCV